MIIQNASIITRKKKIAIIIVSCIINLSLLIALGVIGFNAFITDNWIIPVWGWVLSGIIGTISISDLITIALRRNSYTFAIIQTVERLLNNIVKTKDSYQLTSFQQQFCESVYGLEQKHKFIYIFGRANKGKTTAVLYLLKNMWDNSSNWSELPWPDNLVFVDCTNQKEEIFDFFMMQDSDNRRIRAFSKKIIVIDNIERLGESFIEANKALFSSNKSLFILVEDTKEVESVLRDEIKSRALFSIGFNKNAFNQRDDMNIFKYLISLTSLERQVFFTIYFLTLSSVFACKDDIQNTLRISRFKLNKTLIKLQNSKLFVPFPFNQKYYYCRAKQEIECIESMFKNDLTYNEVINKIVLSESIQPECRWRCLIKCNLHLIKQIDEKKRRNIFNKSLINCNYGGLYEALNASFVSVSEKEQLFLYEKAYLAFLAGDHKASTNCYHKLIDSQKSLQEKNRLMFRIIEANHGDPDPTNMSTIYKWIEYLKKGGGNEEMYAMYWELHIETEKGNFDIDGYKRLRIKFQSIKSDNNSSFHMGLLLRIYSDEIRCHHILGKPLSYEICLEYEKLLKSSSKNGQTKYEYFYNLNVEANSVHYVDIPNAYILRNTVDDSSLVLADLKEKAEIFYERALDSLYNGEKSRRAARIKKIDLEIVSMDFDFDSIYNEVRLFLIHSQANNVGVHEAFCETMLMKICMSDPSNITEGEGFHLSTEKREEIESHYVKGKKIYMDYGNQYGIYRLNFLHTFYKLLTVDPHEMDTILLELANLQRQANSYPKEKLFIDTVFKWKMSNNLAKGQLLGIVKFYPIILQ